MGERGRNGATKSPSCTAENTSVCLTGSELKSENITDRALDVIRETGTGAPRRGGVQSAGKPLSLTPRRARRRRPLEARGLAVPPGARSSRPSSLAAGQQKVGAAPTTRSLRPAGTPQSAVSLRRAGTEAHSTYFVTVRTANQRRGWGPDPAV